MALKVFAGNSRGYDRTRMVVVAAKSKKEAAEIVGVSMHYFNKYWWDYNGGIDANVALREPGKIFSKLADKFGDKLVHTPDVRC